MTKESLICKAPAKINLGLSVLGRRPDGYHDIESVMQQISLADTLILQPSPLKGWRFFCSDQALARPDNLVCRAVEALAARAQKPLPGVDLTLIKNIPVEAGLAGGSADAAAALKALNCFWRLGFKRESLVELGAGLGSDVPFCLLGGTALARGRGELLEKLPALPFFWVVLALPAAVKISTAAAYAAFDKNYRGRPSLQPLVEAVKKGRRRDIESWTGHGLTNTLETAVVDGSELVHSLKTRLRKLGFNPLLSGSGPTLFILTKDYFTARSAALAAGEEGAGAYLCWTVAGSEECSTCSMR